MSHKTKTTSNNPAVWPPDTTGIFTAAERRLFAPVGKTAPAGPVGWTAKEPPPVRPAVQQARTKVR